ncbi:MAG: hypothetical protein IT463_15095, partial [Planctomycetes bacterium]|nr:hypothetical protein [Planctomycetota bacterium]
EGAVSQRDLNRTQRRYLSLRRQADWLADATDRLAERLEQDSRERPDPEGGVAARTRRLPRSTPEVTWDRVAPDAWLSLRGEADLRAAAASSPSGEDARAWEAEDRLRRLAGAAAWLARQLAHDGSQGRALLLVQPLAGEPLGLDSLVEALQSLLRRGFELRVSVLRSDARTGTLLQVDGELAAVAASLEQGVHLLAGETGLCPVQVAVVPSALATPPEPGPVVRVWYPGRRVLDLRSGILTRRAPEPAHLQMFAQGALPLEAAP